MNYQLTLEPRDLLFFHDARPMTGSHEGQGAFWPLPSTFHSALRAALYRRWPENDEQEWEDTCDHPSEREIRRGVICRFGALRTWGPFPTQGDEIYIPMPADVSETEPLFAPIKLSDEMNMKSNLPEPLKYPVGSLFRRKGKSLNPWARLADMDAYLTKGIPPVGKPSSAFYIKEKRPGVGIDPKTKANQQHVFFQAEYLRLQDHAGMKAFAACSAQQGQIDVLGKLFEQRQRLGIIFGGQQGIVYVDCIRDQHIQHLFSDVLPVGNTVRIKWVLLAPALFNAGWLPDWVDPVSGEVKLRCSVDRQGFPNRKAWRLAVQRAPYIRARLVAARIPPPVVLNGWRLNRVRARSKEVVESGPKPSLRLVPAGAVYYFEADSQEEGYELSKQLHGKNKSTMMGEHGFGLGLCGTWTYSTINGGK